MLKAVFATSANPPTLAHVDLILRASKKFSQIFWVVAENYRKTNVFSLEDRLQMMQDCVNYHHLKNVTVDSFSGGVAKYAKKKGASVLIRGLRNVQDFHLEYEMSAGNSTIDADLETFCLLSRPEYSAISSSLVRELASLGEDLKTYVLPPVEERIKKLNL